MLCCLFLTILQTEIQDFLLNFELSTLGSERVKHSFRNDQNYFCWYRIKIDLPLVQYIFNFRYLVEHGHRMYRDFFWGKLSNNMQTQKTISLTTTQSCIK